MDVSGQIIIGLLIVFFLGLFVECIVKYVQKNIPLHPPNKVIKKKWEELTGGDEGGVILGNLERLLFFGAFWIHMPEVVAAWLAFKVASKWQVWSNITSVPKTLPGVDEMEYLIARRRWGSQLLTTFLVGTLSNVIIGFLGSLVGQYGY